MKNYPKVIYFLCFLFIAGIVLFSCSKDNVTAEEKPVNFRTKNIQFLPGDEIAKENVNGDIIFTVKKEDLIKHFEDYWAQQGKSYDLTHIEIVETLVDNDPNNVIYILYGRNVNSTIKVATEINRTASSISAPYPVYTFKQIMQDFKAHISCTSTCQFGCMPAAIKNPSTRKTVLTCSSCENAQTCTKTASV